MSHRMAMPKLVALPPPHIHARQPIRLTARVAVFTVNIAKRGAADDQSVTHTHKKNILQAAFLMTPLDESHGSQKLLNPFSLLSLSYFGFDDKDQSDDLFGTDTPHTLYSTKLPDV